MSAAPFNDNTADGKTGKSLCGREQVSTLIFLCLLLFPLKVFLTSGAARAAAKLKVDLMLILHDLAMFLSELCDD